MLKTNEYGKILRSLRKERGESLNDMSKKLGVSIAFLSALEIGKKSIPLFYCDKVADAYELDDEQRKIIANAIDISNKRVVISLDDKTDIQRDFSLAVARNINRLTDEQMKTLIKLLNE